MKHVESTIQRHLISWVAQEVLPHNPGLTITYVINEGKKNVISATLDKKMGLDSGHPDLYFTKVIDGIKHIWYLELKTKTGTLNPNQKKWHEKYIPAKNSKLATAKGLTHAKEILTEWFLN